MALELMLAEHPSACLTCHRREYCGPFDICLRNVAVTERCVTCPNNGHCELQDVARHIGLDDIRFSYINKGLPVSRDAPFFTRDYNLCILCARCVRMCQEVRGVGAIDLAYRGFQSTVSTAFDRPLMDSGCEFCGACVEVCPTGALMPKERRQPTREVKTICPYCGVGCGIVLGMDREELITVRGDRENPVNSGQLCVKGRFGIVDFVNHHSRLQSPLIKKDGEFLEASWEEALDLVASKFNQYRGDVFAGVSSAKCTNEDNYVFQKFTRVVMGTNNVDHCARL